jgi:dihydroorotase
MNSFKTQVTIAGTIARHDEPPFQGKITIDRESGLVTSVEKGEFAEVDYCYGPQYLIFAGFSDIHIHAREDDSGAQVYKEDYKTAGDAALHGGVVCACAMPNTPHPVINLERLGWHRKRLRALNHPVVILNYLGVDGATKVAGTPGEYPYKLYFGKSVGTLTVMYAGELDVILAKYRGEYVSFHVEYEPIVQASAKGVTHSDRRPAACVNEGLRLLLPLILKHQIKAKLCHWSTGGESFELIEEYRERGCDITLEVSPLHLYFDTSMTDADPSLWTKVQMNPAIQAPTHRQALIDGLRSGFIDFLATDHAPHTEEEKYAAFATFQDESSQRSYKEIALSMKVANPQLYAATCVLNNTSGAPWLDTYALVCVWLMHEHNFSSMDIARVASYNPGHFANRFLSVQFPSRDFGKGFGDIAVGFLGSLTVLNMKTTTTVDRKDLKTKVGWSAFEGLTFSGAVEAVFIGGNKFSRV